MLKSALITFIVLLIAIVTYWILPFQIKRKSEIEYGNDLIKKIELFKLSSNKLPNTDDWEILEEIGFKPEMLGTNPAYTKIDNNNFEILFLDSFDGPFLLWNSNDRKWKTGNPTIVKR